jgi:acylphosphatase
MNLTICRRRFHISGRVQGVGFRAYACSLAQALNLAGWVANTSDGGVEGEVEGSQLKVQKFLDGVKRGPSWARVETFLAQDMLPQSDKGRFTIR